MYTCIDHRGLLLVGTTKFDTIYNSRESSQVIHRR